MRQVDWLFKRGKKKKVGWGKGAGGAVSLLGRGLRGKTPLSRGGVKRTGDLIHSKKKERAHLLKSVQSK